jgi:hypothetical protein
MKFTLFLRFSNSEVPGMTAELRAPAAWCRGCCCSQAEMGQAIKNSAENSKSFSTLMSGLEFDGCGRGI